VTVVCSFSAKSRLIQMKTGINGPPRGPLGHSPDDVYSSARLAEKRMSAGAQGRPQGTK
jgi:hypothetical protein